MTYGRITFRIGERLYVEAFENKGAFDAFLLELKTLATVTIVDSYYGYQMHKTKLDVINRLATVTLDVMAERNRVLSIMVKGYSSHLED